MYLYPLRVIPGSVHQFPNDLTISPCCAVLCVHWHPGHGHLRCLPAAELGVKAGCAAGDDRRLLTADGGLLHLALCPLRRRPQQHRVSGLLQSLNVGGGG